jgi:hypothetical protein
VCGEEFFTDLRYSRKLLMVCFNIVHALSSGPPHPHGASTLGPFLSNTGLLECGPAALRVSIV